MTTYIIISSTPDTVYAKLVKIFKIGILLSALLSDDTYNGVPLLQDLVVLAEGGQEDERGDVLKAVDPFPTL